MQEATKDDTLASVKDDHKQREEPNIIDRDTSTTTERNDAPEQRVLKLGPVTNISAEEMIKKMLATMDKGLEDYMAEEKEVDLRIAAVEDAREVALASSGSAIAMGGFVS